MSKFITSWLAAAAEVLGAELSRPVDLLPGAAIAAGAAAFTLMVDLAGDWEGTFTVTVEQAALAALLAPGSADAEAAREQWQRLFRRMCIEAAAALGRESGQGCEVAMISPEEVAVGAEGMGYQLRVGETMAALRIADRVEAAPPAAAVAATASAEKAPPPGESSSPAAVAGNAGRGIELLLDVELEASLRFGSREMPLSELLGLGPGDVIQLDRALSDPVDLIIGDKIVARGEVVLVNGNFGLQVTEVAEPRKSLESIRCLF